MSGHIQEPFKAYEGDEPFMFVSYSHADKQEVFQDMEYLNRVKYRIWYDEGRRAYEELYQRIAAKIMACSYFLAFLSPNTLESSFVSREVLFGLEKRKVILPVYLSELNLTPQLEFPLRATLKLKKYELSTDEYFRLLMRTIPESVRRPSIDEEFATIIDSRIEQAGSWNEDLRAPLMVGAERLGLQAARATKVLEEKAKQLVRSIPDSLVKGMDKKATPIALNKAAEHSDYEAFISYRRESGAAEARLIQEKLRQRNKRAFLDVDDLRPGHFDQELLRRIEEARNFIIILSPNCLARCADERDWLRQEIVHALKTSRNVIPIMLPGFEFPNTRSLPDELQTLATHHCVIYNHEYFDAMVDKIVRYLGLDQ